MNNCNRYRTILLAVIVLLGASEVNAQWVFVARKALGRIERMTQPPTSGVPSYDVATVVIEGRAEKVYGTDRNRWPNSLGFTGCLQSEYASPCLTLGRNSSLKEWRSQIIISHGQRNFTPGYGALKKHARDD